MYTDNLSIDNSGQFSGSKLPPKFLLPTLKVSTKVFYFLLQSELFLPISHPEYPCPIKGNQGV